MSIPSIKPDIGSKVLPGDKTGLPWEIWRIILSYLSAEDLCCCACVCKTWNDLVISLDSSRWKELYLLCGDWKHPFWPMNTDSEPASWRLAYKEQYVSSRFWTRGAREPDQAACFYVLKRRKDRKVIRVGRGMEHSSLKSALAVANDYDRIEIYPGIYDEQFEMSSKIPFEIIGVGELGSIILVVCIEQIALTGRVSNLVFRAPWFTNFILKVRTGYLQVDNCILEDGMVYVQNPGSCHVKFCTFRHATIILQHLNSSIIENCEFSQTDSAAITVEGYPRDDRNWTYGYMLRRIASVSSIQRLQQNKGYETAPTSAYSTSTALTHKKLLEKFDESKTDSFSGTDCGGFAGQSMGSTAHMSLMHSDITEQAAIHSSLVHNFRKLSFGNQPHAMDILSHSLHLRENSTATTKSTTQRENSTATTKSSGTTKSDSTKSGSRTFAVKASTEEQVERETKMNKADEVDGKITRDKSYEENVEPSSSQRKLSESNVSIDKYSHDSFTSAKSEQSSSSSKSPKCLEKNVGENDAPKFPPLNLNQEEPQQHQDNQDARSRSLSRSQSSQRSSRSNSPISTASGSDFFDDEEDSIGGFDSGSANSSHRGGSSSTSSEDDVILLSDTESDFSDEEESVIMLTCPEHQQPRSVSALSIGADVQSICSQNQSEHIRIVHDSSMQKILDEVRGCLIHRCRMTQCKGAVMVSLQAHAVVSHCDINSVGYGIRCIQNARVILLKNEIHHCRTSGIFMRLAASGLIAGNDIHSNCEAGIDIRKNADPSVVSNRIHHGKRSGIVVLGSGRGQIKNNEIYQNKEAGVYILYRGNPIISKNQIYSGKAAGVAVNEGGRGYIQDNTITGNQWGGVDIRHGGDPVITQNVICNGLSDGIVIGEKGKGSIENNVISGNAGCGVWITAACQPMIHGNQINGNGDTGITFVNKTDELHEADTLDVDRSEMHSQKSMEFWQMMNDEQPHPRRMCHRATVEYNSIYHNNGRGIAVKFGDEVSLLSNAVHGNRGDGIYVDQEPCVLIKDNSVTCNAGDGITTTKVGQVRIVGNGVYDNRDHGILARNNVTISENDVTGNQRCAIKAEANTNLEIKHNRLQSKNEKVLCVGSVQKGAVCNNTVYSCNAKSSVHVTPESKCSVHDNEVITMETNTTNNSLDTGSSSNNSKGFWILNNPPARPHIEAPPSIPTLPANQVTTVTRVTVPSAGNCEEGSKLCIIL